MFPCLCCPTGPEKWTREVHWPQQLDSHCVHGGATNGSLQKQKQWNISLAVPPGEGGGGAWDTPSGCHHWTVTVLRPAVKKISPSRFWRLQFGGTPRKHHILWLGFMTLVTTATEHISNFNILVPSNILQEPLPLLLLSHEVTPQLCLWWCVGAALEPESGPITSLTHCTSFRDISGVIPAYPRRSNGKINPVPPAILIWTLCTDRLDAFYRVPGAYLEAWAPALHRSLHNGIGALQDHVTQLQHGAPEKCSPKGRELEKGTSWSHCKELRNWPGLFSYTF